MKLVNRKTRKAIKKSVRKAMKKQGPALMAGVVSGLAAALAALAKTDAPDRRGTSTLSNLLQRLEQSFTEGSPKKSRDRRAERDEKRHAATEVEDQ